MKFHSSSTIHVDHIHLYIKDLNKVTKFYREVLGFSLLDQTVNKAVLTADGKNPIITLEVPSSLEGRNPRSTGLYHLAILLPHRNDLAAFVLHLIQKKVPFGSSDHLVSEAIYFSDPEQNGIEVYIDRDPHAWSWQQGQVQMAVDPIDFHNLLKDVEKLPLWEGAPKDTVLGHIHLHVKDLKETVKFYTDGLGFQIVSALGNQAVFLSDGGYHHHIGMNTWQGVGAPAKKPLSAGLHTYRIQYPDEEKRQQAIHRLDQMGYSIMKVEADYMSADPSQNHFVLSVAK